MFPGKPASVSKNKGREHAQCIACVRPCGVVKTPARALCDQLARRSRRLALGARAQQRTDDRGGHRGEHGGGEGLGGVEGGLFEERAVGKAITLFRLPCVCG